MTGRELWFVGPRKVEVRRANRSASLAEGEVRAQALASGISQGTELLLYAGEGPTPFDPSLDEAGAPTYPRRYGYCWVGEVCETRSAPYPLGCRVFALAPHGDEHVAASARLHRIPVAVPAERAVLAANLETAINVVWDAGIALGDDVLVMGGGVVGLLCGYAARRGGARRVSLIEPSEVRRQAAVALGFDAVMPPGGSGSADFDVVIEATGNPASLDAAIARARFEGVIAVASFYGCRVASVSLGAEFHRRRLTLRASQVSHISPARAARYGFERRFELVREFLGDPSLDVLLSPSVPFAQAPEVYERLAAAPGEALQTVFCYAP